MEVQEHWSAAEYQAYLKGQRAGNKFHAKKTLVNGREYDSRSEANRACELRMLERRGFIRNLREQVPFVLIDKQSGEYRKERPLIYKADFVYEQMQGDGSFKQIVEDNKGHRTKDYIIKRKLMLYIHGISIYETG